MDISVIIPAKNEGFYLTKTLPALANSLQYSGLTWEILLIDNGSTDNTIEIAKKFGCYVNVCDKNTIAGLRNFGANLAKGKYIAFLDADCVVGRKWVHHCIENLHLASVGATGTRAVPSKEYGNWVSWAWFALAAGSKKGDDVPWIGTSNLLIKKSLFVELRGFDEDLQTAEDVDFCTRLSLKYKIRLEKRINTIHLREPTSLLTLFKKEVWRGKSSFVCFLKNGCQISELPSVVVPFFVGAFFLLTLCFGGVQPWIVIIFFVQLMLFPLILMKKKGVSFNSPIKSIKIFIVALFFILARSVAIYLEIYSICIRRKF